MRKAFLIMLLLAIIPVVAAETFNPPIHYWRFEGDLLDEGEGIPYNLSNSGTTFATNPCKLGQCVNYTAGTGVLSVTGVNFTDVRSVSGWFYTEVDSREFILGFNNGGGYSSSWYVGLERYGGDYRFYDVLFNYNEVLMWESNAGYGLTSGWHHFVIDIGSGGKLVWVDGAEVSFQESVDTSVLDDYINGLYIGARYDALVKWKNYLDDIAFFDYPLNDSQVQALYNNGTGMVIVWKGAPVINQASYNCTSCFQNNTAWRVNTSFPIPTYDSTPTVTFTLNRVGSGCAISLYDLNITGMRVNDSNSICGTTNTDSMTCTLPSTMILSPGITPVYFACNSSIGEETVLSGSGPLYLDYYGYLFRGYIKDLSNPVPGAKWYLFRQSDMVLVANGTSNSSGEWEANNLMNDTYVSVFFYNNTLGGDAVPWINPGFP